jgi:hypothetical protein
MPRRRLVLIPVRELDLRATAALAYAAQIDADDRRAVHVVEDEQLMQELGTTWMAHGISWPLSVVDDVGGVAATIGSLVEHELDSGFNEVVVLVGQLAVRHRWHRLLHDRTGEAIGRVVDAIPGALTAMMIVAAV